MGMNNNGGNGSDGLAIAAPLNSSAGGGATPFGGNGGGDGANSVTPGRSGTPGTGGDGADKNTSGGGGGGGFGRIYVRSSGTATINSSSPAPGATDTSLPTPP
jgi:hypothetical protein